MYENNYRSIFSLKKDKHEQRYREDGQENKVCYIRGITFCFQPGLWNQLKPVEHIIQPHAGYLGAAAWWKTHPAYSANTSHPHQLPLPSPQHPRLSSPAAVAASAAAAAPRENLHFNRQSCSPSPNEGMCSGEQQETHPAAQVSNEPSRQFQD